MSDPSASPTAPAKPGTACLGCRRRKLKCSRGSPCNNCSKADLPCIYTAPEAGVKRKRGPYNKDKSARERHLEDVVRYLGSTANAADSPGLNHGVVPPNGEDGYTTKPEESPEPLEDDALREQLVKDALSALTRPRTPDDERGHNELSPPDVEGRAIPVGASYPILNPPIDHIMRYMYIFRQRVDPLTKVLHWPTFSQWAIGRITNASRLEPGERALVYSVYFAAITACTAPEVHSAFGAEKSYLLAQYGRLVETVFSQTAEVPSVVAIQALLIYMTCLRRTNKDGGHWILFSLGVRMAQLMGLDKEPARNLRPLEAEMRRRLWWTLCANESRGAEEGSMRKQSIMQGTAVRFPLNLNDFDLSPDMDTMPQARDGVTDVSFCLHRWKLTYLAIRMWEVRAFRPNITNDNHLDEEIEVQQYKILHEFQNETKIDFEKYYSKSRPMDLMIIATHELLTLKGEVIIHHPQGMLKTCLTRPEKRIRGLRYSNRILHLTHQLSSDHRWRPWHWYFGQYVQWHSLAIIVTELSESRDAKFVEVAWKALEPILVNWDHLFESRKHEGPWDHVNTLIQRAKRRREHFLSQQISGAGAQPSREYQTDQPTGARDFITSLDQSYTGSPVVADSGWSSSHALSVDSANSATTTFDSPMTAASNYSNGDPFAEFDPEAFEQVFSSFDWDSLGPLGDLVGDFT